MSKPLITIVETGQFQRRVGKRLSANELDRLKVTLAANPTLGDVIPGGGGIRKVRVASRGKGKSGGSRVIYYYYDESIPVFLLDVYAKSEQDDLSKDHLAALADLAGGLADGARKKRSRK